MSIERDSISVDSFSFAPSSSIGSFSSFESSLDLSGGSFNPTTNFSDFVPMTSEFISPISLDTGFEKTIIPSAFEVGLADINLNPDVVAEIAETVEVPQSYYDAFEEPTPEEIFTPPTYLESIIEPTFITEPEITEIPDEILETPTLEILDRKIVEEALEETAIVNEEIIQEIIPELVIQNAEQMVSEDVIVEAAEELISLSETTSILPDVISEPVIIPEVIQASRTYESLVTAGIEEAQATELVQTALIKSGIELEAAQQIVTEITTGTETDLEVEQIIAEEIEISEEEKEEKQERKTEYKFVIDEKALKEREAALGKALVKAPSELKDGKETVDIYQVIKELPTESEKPSVISEILDQTGILIISADGDESYREAINALRSLDKLSKEVVFQRGREIFEKLPPVRIAETGIAVKEIDVERVLSSKLDSILKTKKYITYNKPNNN